MSATVVTPTAEFGSLPDRSLAQRLDALVLANDIRSRRAQLKRDVKAGRVSVLDVITDPPEFVLTMKVLDLLMAAPQIGRTKALKLLKRCEISPAKAVGGISFRQRDCIVAGWIWGRS